MGVYDSPLTPQQLEIYSRLLRDQQARKWKRSTLSAGSALTMRPYLNALLNDPKTPILIPYSAFPRCNPRTIATKWNDAIRWYMELDPTIAEEERNAIAFLKLTSKIFFEDEGLRICMVTLGQRDPRANSPTKELEKQATAQHQYNNTVWKQQFLEWLSAGDASTPFSKTGLTLSVDDIAWLESICKPNGWFARITMYEIFISKEDE